MKKKPHEEYIVLNAMAKLSKNSQKDSYKFDKKAANLYLEQEIKPNLKIFTSIEDRINFLVKNDYYEASIINQYSIKEIEKLYQDAYSFNHSFPTFMGVAKFFNSYCLKSFDGSQYLEQYEDRVLMNALFLGAGNFQSARKILKAIMSGAFQPATPTFLNAGKKQRGEYVSCYLLRVEDNMESIARGIASSLQLSKRGGGVALCLTNLREMGAPIKKIENQSTGIIPVMKLLEDSFSYANQLGQRQGAGAVYLSAHHPEIMTFLDSKRENADEKIRIKSLSLGIIVPDITLHLAKENKKMALFSPYDVERVYGKAMSDISITKEYENMVNNPQIKKTYISARKLFKTIAELHFESGYPYIMFDDTVNNNKAHPGRIVMSNLCSEIAQVSTPSTYKSDLSYIHKGEDICCNLGSINIAKIMDQGHDFEEIIASAIKSLTIVSQKSNFSSTPSIEVGNTNNNAIGLGAMNLHGFLATNGIFYDSPEAIDFTNVFFYTLAYYAFKASCQLATKFGKFKTFNQSGFASGEYFKKYTTGREEKWLPQNTKIKKLFAKYQVNIPNQQNWKDLVKEIKINGLANAYLLAIAPTGSISYLSSCTPSLQPVVAPVEVRKEGKLGRMYFPAYKISKANEKYYQKGAYEMGPNPIIDIVATAQQHVDQAISLTLFFKDTATTRDLNRAYIRAFAQGCKTIYYVRIRQDVINGSENLDDYCEACVI